MCSFNVNRIYLSNSHKPLYMITKVQKLSQILRKYALLKYLKTISTYMFIKYA